jgi:hypothetical protein
MKCDEFDMWIINIDNAASRVAAKYGSYIVDSIFAIYGAHGLYDLSPCYFSEVFADLELIANEN